jgi:hypothetical protein
MHLSPRSGTVSGRLSKAKRGRRKIIGLILPNVSAALILWLRNGPGMSAVAISYSSQDLEHDCQKYQRTVSLSRSRTPEVSFDMEGGICGGQSRQFYIQKLSTGGYLNQSSFSQA